MAELKYWLWMAGRLRPAAAKQLLEQLDGPADLYFADEARLERLEILTRRERERLLDKDLKAEGKCLAACERADVRILTLGDAEYPARLKSLFDPPTVLYLKGRLPAIDEEAAIAFVGTRRTSVYGERQAERLAYEAACHGGLVVSGLAGASTAPRPGAPCGPAAG